VVLVMSFFPVDEGDDGVLAVVGVLEVFPASFSLVLREVCPDGIPLSLSEPAL